MHLRGAGGHARPDSKAAISFLCSVDRGLLRLKRLPSHEEACDANLLHFATHTHERYASYELERIDGSDTRQEVTRQAFGVRISSLVWH